MINSISTFIFTAILSSWLLPQSGTFDFTNAASNGSYISQTVSGVTLNVSGSQDVQLLTNNFPGMSGNICVSISCGYMTLVFSSPVNISTIRFTDWEGSLNSFKFTPNIGVAKTFPLYDSYGQTAALNFIGITSINIVRADGGSFSPAIDNIVMDSELPVELISFTASVINSKVVLNWSTATEVNNYRFQLERKANTGAWVDIGFISGAENSNEKINYSYTDDNLSTKGIYFYRLKQLDLDGSYSFSPTVEVDFTGVTEFMLEQNFPNPFNPTTKIEFRIPETSNTVIKVFDDFET